MAGSRPTSFDVRVWKISSTLLKSGATTYRLRWAVGGKRHSANYKTFALADSERAELVSALRRGEAFDVESGQPTSRLRREEQSTSWWEWALTFVDAKWPDLAPTSRKTLAQELAIITLALCAEGGSRPTDERLRAAMVRWAFNAPARARGPAPENLAVAARWLQKHTRPLADLEERTVCREVLDAIAVRLDGRAAAATSIARRRAVFHNILEMAVEREMLATNPLDRLRWKRRKSSERLDPRVVATPAQARALLEAVRLGWQADSEIRKRQAAAAGERLVAFFGSMYYAALRPSEATELAVADLEIPEEGWGWLLITNSNAEISDAWSENNRRGKRQLKHRPIGDVRRVPCPPPLTQLLREHLANFETQQGGLLFRGPYGGQMSSKAYMRIWSAARHRALTKHQAASSLVHRPYDLRHSAVSTWLAAGVDPVQVAAWAGHSVAVLHRVYAHVLSGRDAEIRERIESALRLAWPR